LKTATAGFHGFVLDAFSERAIIHEFEIVFGEGEERIEDEVDKVERFE
jgi:hypothetical protein